MVPVNEPPVAPIGANVRKLTGISATAVPLAVLEPTKRIAAPRSPDCAGMMVIDREGRRLTRRQIECGRMHGADLDVVFGGPGKFDGSRIGSRDTGRTA
jgi:hypothetical protein